MTALAALFLWVCCKVFTFYSPTQEQQNQSTAGEEEEEENKLLLFLHYHKTGHDLSRILATQAFHVPYIKFKRSSSIDHVIATAAQNVSNSTIFMVAAVDLGTQWKDWQLLSNRHVKIVHFVRDPLDWTLSAYLYHTQRPIPREERKWINRQNSSCNGRKVQQHSHILSNDTLYDIERLCRNLTALSAKKSFASQIAALSEHNGLRLEASRGMLGSDHGDLSLMGQHLEASRHVNNVLTFVLSEFTSSKSMFQSSARKLCLFGSHILQLQNRTMEQCVQDAVQYGWIDVDHIQSAHVTSNRRSNIEKQELKQMLLDDPVLGPPLFRLQQLVQRVCPNGTVAP